MSNSSTNHLPPDPLSATAAAPLVLWASANSYQERLRQQALAQERRSLQRLFAPAGGHPVPWPGWLMEAPREQVYVFDLLRRHQFDPRVQVLHLSGFSLGRHLHLQGGLGEEALRPAAVGHLLSRLPGLRLIFLNGCATPALLRALLRNDVPAILATQAAYNRTDLLHLAYRFYQQLLAGGSLQAAFRRVQRIHRQGLPCFSVQYDLTQDAFTWQAPPGCQAELANGLYVQAHHPDIWQWRLRDTSPATQPLASPQPSPAPSRRPIMARLTGLL